MIDVFPHPVLPCKTKGDFYPSFRFSIYLEMASTYLFLPGTLEFRNSVILVIGIFLVVLGV